MTETRKIATFEIAGDVVTFEQLNHPTGPIEFTIARKGWGAITRLITKEEVRQAYEVFKCWETGQ